MPVLLELAHAALEDAACDPDRFPGRIGVFACSIMNTCFMNSGLNARFAADNIPTVILSDMDCLSTQIICKLGLHGPSGTIQRACSTSLAAIHLARQSLLNQESDMAFAGAVSVRIPPSFGCSHDGGAAGSTEAHVRSYEVDAAGTMVCSGGGVIVMRRLADALVQGDHIYAVIKGYASINDSCAKPGDTAPGANRPADVIVQALANAGVDAESISCVEVHGSGTPEGDPIEILALTKAFRNFTERNGYCAIGTVRTDAGHLDGAAGMAGLFKTVLALQHRCLPPTQHYSKANPGMTYQPPRFM